MTQGWLTERLLRLPDGTLPHLGIKGGGDVAKVALLSGSPERVELMASMLDGVAKVGDRRGYSVYTGEYGGSPVSVATSGVGSPSLAIAVEEMGACGTRVFVRVGSCASISPEVGVGDVVIADTAVSAEGTSSYYLLDGAPAPAASHRVTEALVSAARSLGVAPHVGRTRSTDSFYEGERRPELIERWSSAGVLTFEMETSALFAVCAARGWEAGSILVPGSNLITNVATYRGEAVEAFREGQARMVQIALAAGAALAIAAALAI